MGFKRSLVPCVHYFAVLLVTIAIQKAAFPLLKFTLFFFFQLPSTFSLVVYTSTV